MKNNKRKYWEVDVTGISWDMLMSGCCSLTISALWLAIDESSLSNGELYSFVTNRDACTRKRSLVAVVAGTKSEEAIAMLLRIDEEKRLAVEEVTLDLPDSMRKIVRMAFQKSSCFIGRSHIRKLACDAVQELRIKHRCDAIQQANDEMEEAKSKGDDYAWFRYPNGDTGRELLIRSHYLLFKSADNRTERQKQRAEILFENSNALAESFNAKIKLFCENLKGVVDKKFFHFRLANLYAYPH